MNKLYPQSIDDFKELSYNLYSIMLPSYFWLNSDFTTSYRFMPLFEDNNILKKGRLQTIYANAPETACFDQNYYAEYFDNEQRLFLTFNSERFLVENISIFYGVVTALIMYVVSPSGSTEYFYAAKSNPFSPVYRKFYDL